MAVLSTVPAAVWFTYDPEVEIVSRNTIASEFMGMQVGDERSFAQAGNVPGVATIRVAGRAVKPRELPLQRAMAGESIHDVEYEFVTPRGTRIVLISASPIVHNSDTPIGAVAVGLDITDRKRNEEQRRLLTNELNHRVKNTLATVQSLALQTLKNATSLDHARSQLQSRLIALSKAHDVLNKESWQGGSLLEVAANVLPASEQRIKVDGPPVRLRPTSTMALGLILHEFAVNAVKHGALRSEEGSITLSWQVMESGSGSELHLNWRESGGPIIVPPQESGFGTVLIKRLIAAEPSGSVRLSYAPAGLFCELRFLINGANQRTAEAPLESEPHDVSHDLRAIDEAPRAPH